jgi:hypothetical protein
MNYLSLRSLLSLLLVLSSTAARAAVTPVCDRTPAVKAFIEKTVAKPCQDITEIDLASIKRIGVERQNIAAFKADDFSGLTGLEILNIRSNPFRELPEGLFKDLVHLKTLVIIDTPLRHYPDDYLTYSPEIENLYTFRNQVRSISESILSRIKNARKLKEMEFDGALQDPEKNRLRQEFPAGGPASLLFH